MSITRLTGKEITADAAVGKLLVRYSHTGEDPDPRVTPDRKWDDVTDGGFAPIPIAAVRHSDSDNLVAVLCGRLLVGAALDEKGQVVKEADGRVVKGPLFPPEGEYEFGFDDNGWIEVDDGS